MAIRLLYVEDDPALHRFMKAFAAKFNYDLYEAYTGKTALEKAHDLLPDVIVTDIDLPDINGDKVCLQLKMDDETKHIPIIAFTGHRNMHGDRERLLQRGFDGYVDKPFNSVLMKHTIERVLKEHQA